MGSLRAWVLYLLCATLVLADVVPLSSVHRVTNLPTVQNRFIIELASSADIPQGHGLSSSRPQDSVYVSLRHRNVPFEVDREYNSEGVFIGAVVTLKNAQDVAAILETPGVIAVRPVKVIQGPKPIDPKVVDGPNDPAIPPDPESTHILTGVDKLHAEGVTGIGIKIGIIDTGIDYTHPLLGDGFGPGHKVIGGYDFVGDAYNGSNAPKPDPDPLDQCNGHGTHVAGIIGANPGNEFNISGVAYAASLTSYRIFGCQGFVTDDIIIDALLLGVKENQDILTLSLGGADGWTESSSAVVASRIAALGKVVTIAAGNDGASGSWYTSSPGNGINVISVASLENTVVPLQEALVNGVRHDPIIYFSLFPLPAKKPVPIYATSNDTTIIDDACNPLPDNTPDLSPFVVIIRRGSCTFVQKLTNIAAKGAKLALIYDNGNGFSGISTGNFTAALIQAADGLFLVEQFVAGVPVTITFPQTGGSINFPSPVGGLISTFSSYGPSNDFFFKPAVAAPGGNILSTLPVPLGSFGVESGTSMATPFVAGSAALLFEVKGKSADVGRGARTLFETTAERVSSSHTDGDPLQTVTQQGAGLINVHNALRYTTVVTPGELILNDTAHYRPVHRITITNTAKRAKTYKLTHVPAGTAETVVANTTFSHVGPVPLNTAFATVEISRETITVGPGETTVVIATIFPPEHVDPATFPVFSGFIQIESGNEALHVTYLGLAAALKDKQVVDNTPIFFGFVLPAILDSHDHVQHGPMNYTFLAANVPSVLFRLVFGTPVLRIDLVDPNIRFTPTLNSRAFEHRPNLFFPHRGSGSFAKVPILGVIAEMDYITRNNENPTDNGYNVLTLNTPTFANGTTIPNGTYRLLLRALRVTGDPTRQEDYESWLSPIIGIVPGK
ncbi:hypothetical protein AX17_004252 [Amanita inopinata Kibby_2008]|nr:hypothetical protein AX17_004252 [Amanita inopinata Kibby_2008]